MTLKEKLQNFCCFLLISVFVFIIIKNAWVCDDSYITFRVLDNFVNGFGLRWNIADRVQSFTNPLWLMVLTPFYLLTHEIYYTSLVISILLSFSALILICRNLKISYPWLFAGLLIFICSNSFVDFSTSGLENALAHFLFTIFMIIYFRDISDKFSFFILNFLAGLITLNRIDHGVIILPFLISAFLSYNRFKFNRFFKLQTVCLVVTGFLPFIIWTVFSVIYYGFPFPNTAYAKLNTGIERIIILKQGGFYLLDFIRNDYTGAGAVIIALLFSFPVKKQKQFMSFFFSLVLYIFYIVWIGGDFMSGRFFTILILISTVVIIRQTKSVYFALFLIPVILGCSLINPKSTVLSWINYSDRTINNSIADERGYYFKFTGLFNSKPFSEKPIDPFKNKGKKDGFLIIKDGVGFSGYNFGHKYHILDRYALGEPLLARIPYQMPYEKKPFRPGHLGREFPQGIVETYKTGINNMVDSNLYEYFQVLSMITRGDIFTFKRFENILKMNTGGYNYLIDNYIMQRSIENSAISEKEIKTVSLQKFYVENREYFTHDINGLPLKYDNIPGIVCIWNGSLLRERYLIDWINPEGKVVFSKYIYEDRRAGTRWYPYLGQLPLSKGKWSLTVKKVPYRDIQKDTIIGKTDFEID